MKYEDISLTSLGQELENKFVFGHNLDFLNNQSSDF